MALFSKKITHEELVQEIGGIFTSFLIVHAQEMHTSEVDGSLFAAILTGYAYPMKERCGVSYRDIDRAAQEVMESLEKDGAIITIKH
jgi:hypothetical protein